MSGILSGTLASVALLALPAYAATSSPVQVNQYRVMPIPCLLPPSSTGEYRFEPGCVGRSYAGALVTTMKFNSAGMRDREYAPSPPAGTLRILLMGASNVLGQGVDENETLARRLQSLLEKKLRVPVEVLNGATAGYYTWQSAMRMHVLLDQYHPHVVLYNVQMPTCFIFDSAWERRIVTSPAGDPLRYDRSPLGEKSWLVRLNSLYFSNPRVFLPLHTVHDQLRRLLVAIRVRISGEKRADVLVASTRRALDYMSERSARADALFIGFYNDSPESIYNQFVPGLLSYRTVNFFTSITPVTNVAAGELELELAKSKAKLIGLVRFNYLSIPGDPHLSPEGIKYWAQRLVDSLLESRGFAGLVENFGRKSLRRKAAD